MSYTVMTRRQAGSLSEVSNRSEASLTLRRHVPGGGMQGASTQVLLFVVGLVAAAVGFIGIVFAVNKLLAPQRPTREKNLPYECGLDQAGRPWSAQRLRFSTVAMIFVLFDAEAVLLFAVSTQLRGNLISLYEVAVFVLFLALGLAYAWKKGALEWRS